MFKKALAVTAGILLLTGCASSSSERYETVGELAEAFAGAGGDCSTFEQTNRVEGATQSATCSTLSNLSVYESKKAVKTRIADTEEFNRAIGSGGDEWLVGENWIINAPNVHNLQELLGGKVVTLAS